MIMRVHIIVLALVFGSSAVRAQDTFLLMNARADEHASCLSEDKNPNATMTSCGKADSQGEVAMRLGRTVRLRVLHRRFLTDYSLEVADKRTVPQPVRFGGTVLAVALPRAAGPVPAVHPRIERRATAEFLSGLVDVTTSSEPLADIEREYEELLVEQDQVRSAVRDFSQTWSSVIGSPPVSGCGTGDLQMNVVWLEACLHGEYSVLSSAAAPAAAPPLEEKGFRSRAAEVDGLFHETRELSERLAQADLTEKAMRVEGAIRGYQEDELSFWANLDSAKEAAWIVERLTDVPDDSALWLRVRELLRTQRGTADTGKPVLDEAETNLVIEQSFGLLKNRNGFQQRWQQELKRRLDQLQPANRDPVEFDSDLSEIRTKAHRQLPDVVSQINNWQQRLAAEMNDIYWNSDVGLTESDWGLGPIPKDGVVSYRIVRTSEFAPYVFQQTRSETLAPEGVEVSRGAMALTDTNAPHSRSTVWQILRLTK